MRLLEKLSLEVTMFFTTIIFVDLNSIEHVWDMLIKGKLLGKSFWVINVFIYDILSTLKKHCRANKKKVFVSVNNKLNCLNIKT